MMRCVVDVQEELETKARELRQDVERLQQEKAFVVVGVVLLVVAVAAPKLGSRHAPHALDIGIVSEQLFNRIHIGAGRGHGDIDHVNAQVLTDAKVAVVTRYRAQEFYRAGFFPGTVRAVQADTVGQVQHLVHEGQAAVAADQDVGGIGGQNSGK